MFVPHIFDSHENILLGQKVGKWRENEVFALYQTWSLTLQLCHEFSKL